MYDICINLKAGRLIIKHEKSYFKKTYLPPIPNADNMPPKMLVSGILILTYFGTGWVAKRLDTSDPLHKIGFPRSTVPKYVKMRIPETNILGGMWSALWEASMFFWNNFFRVKL